MDQKPLDYLRCVVERITYQSDGYSVLKCAAKGYNDLIAVVGMMPDTHVGSVLTVGGHWKIDSKYGRQFEVVTFEETLPATVYGTQTSHITTPRKTKHLHEVKQGKQRTRKAKT